MTYLIRYERQAERQLRRLLRGGAPTFKRRYEETVARLREEPSPYGEGQGRFQIKRLSNGEWSIRVDIHHRIRYVVQQGVVIITRVSQRESAYDDV